MNQRQCVMCMNVAVALAMYYWLGWRSEFSENTRNRPYQKSVFTDSTWIECLCCSWSRDFVIWALIFDTIPTLRHISLFVQLWIHFPFPLSLSYLNRKRQERAEPGRARNERANEKKINIFYILCDLCHFESIRTVHILYYNVYCWRWYCIIFHGSLWCAWLFSNANKTSCDWRAHHINRELSKRVRARECTTGKKRPHCSRCS